MTRLQEIPAPKNPVFHPASSTTFNLRWRFNVTP
jgi:hypothetical protein